MASNKLSLEQDKDEIRAELKCLVVASPKNLTVGNLAHNYEEATGKKLDTHKFGYQTLTGFIRSMAETFKVEREWLNNAEQLFVRLVDNSNVSHIDSMVTKQRCNLPSFRKRQAVSSVDENSCRQNRRNTSKSPGRRHSRSRYSVSPGRRQHSHTRRRSYSRERWRPRSPPRARRRRPSSTSESDSSSSSSGKSTTSSNLTSASRMQKKKGTDNAAKISLEKRDQLQSSIKKGSIAEEIAKKVRVLLQDAKKYNQKNCASKSKANAEKSPQTRPSTTAATDVCGESALKIFINSETAAAPTLASTLQQEGPTVAKKVGEQTDPSTDFRLTPDLSQEIEHFTLEKSNEVPCNSDLIPQSIFDFGLQHRSIFAGDLVRPIQNPATLLKSNCDTMSVSSIASSSIFSKKRGDNFLPSSVKRNLIRLLQKFPSGIPASQLADKYKNCFNQDLNVQDFGYSNVIDMATSQPSTVQISTNSSSEVIIKIADFPTESIHEIPFAKFVPDAMKQKIASILNKFPNGATLDEIADIYQKTYGKILAEESKRLGFVSLLEMLQEIDALRVHKWGAEVRVSLHGFMLSPNYAVRMQPNNSIPLGFKLPMSELQFKESMAPVVVSETYSPHKFFVQFKRSINRLNDMMKQLQILYDTIEGSMRVFEAKAGLYIVAKFNYEWHRGQVIEVVTPTKCRIMYIDYGTFEEKDISELRYLIDEPAFKVETMAVEASLYNLKPPNCDAEYSFESCQKFSELTGTDVLFAKYKGGNEQNATSVVKLILIHFDLQAKKIIMNVNDVLANEGYADYIVAPVTPIALPTISTAIVQPQPMNQVANRFSNIDTSRPPAIMAPTAQIHPPQMVSVPPMAPARQTAHLPFSAAPALQHEFGPESDMPLLILQDITGKLVSTYGEPAVRQAVDRLQRQPFPSADATAVSNMSNMLYGSAMQSHHMLQPHPTQFNPGHNPMLPPAACSMPQLPLTHPMSNVAPRMQIPPIILPPGMQMDMKPTLVELLQASNRRTNQPTPIPLTQTPISSFSSPSPPITPFSRADTLPVAETSSAVDRKPSVAELLLTNTFNYEDDEDITFIEAIKEVKDVSGPITRYLNSTPFYFLVHNKRYYVLCEDFAKRVLQKPSWAEMLSAAGRTNEAMEVCNLKIASNKHIISQMPGREDVLDTQANLQIAPVDAILKVKFRDAKYPLIAEFKTVVSKLPGLEFRRDC